ncbi:hypothetical protein BJY00DRAFT_1832 [Aspergillus carlsbadensis]|nr:hypothetical protein BJY00DRAFT_1832 [Aspergillus carlsbadensis]
MPGTMVRPLLWKTTPGIFLAFSWFVVIPVVRGQAIYDLKMISIRHPSSARITPPSSCLLVSSMRVSMCSGNWLIQARQACGVMVRPSPRVVLESEHQVPYIVCTCNVGLGLGSAMLATATATASKAPLTQLLRSQLDTEVLHALSPYIIPSVISSSYASSHLHTGSHFIIS